MKKRIVFIEINLMILIILFNLNNAFGENTVEKIVFYSGRSGNNEIYIMNTDGSEQQNLTNHSASDLCPALSPKGDKIAFLSDRNGNQEIYVMNVDGTNVQMLTETFVSEEHASWSPDGTKIFFMQDYMSRTEIWVMNADGSNPQRLTNNSARDERPFMSPDGSTILFMSNRNGNYDIYKMDPDGSNQRRMTSTTGHEIFPIWSPDGTKIAYSNNVFSGGKAQAEIHVINSDGSGDVALTSASGRDENPCWSPDGNYIVFQSERDGNFEIYKMNVDGSNQIRLTNSAAWDGWASWGFINESTSKVNKNGSLLNENYQLFQNYPNPFNSETKIGFSMPNTASVDLKIYDISGREIYSLIERKFDAGFHHICWNGKEKNGSFVASGVYFYKIIINGFCLTRKMIFAK